MRKNLMLLAAFALVSTAAVAGDLAANPLYKSKCAMCHGAAGEGKPAMKVAPLKDSAAKSEADLTALIAKGKGKMPGYEGKLTAEQIKQMVAEIKAIK